MPGCTGMYQVRTVGLRYTDQVSIRQACQIGLVSPLFPSPISSVSPRTLPLAFVSGQLSRHFPLDIKRWPPQCCPRHITQFIIYVVLEVVTMAMVGTTVVLPSVAPLSDVIHPTGDAVNDLSKLYLNNKGSGSFIFCALPVYTPMVGLPLNMISIVEVDICDYLGWSSLHSFVGLLYLDPQKYDKPPIARESLIRSPHWMQLKVALQLAAPTSGSPVICNGSRDNCAFQCKLCKPLYRPLLGKKEKKDNAPWQDDCINMDKGGRQTEGRLQCKRTRSTKALTSNKLCPFKFTMKWDFYGFCVAVEKEGYGCPN
jgi:hypothetical protein